MGSKQADFAEKKLIPAGAPCVDTDVLTQAQAGEFRRAMFVLCTLALMGTEDQLMQAKGKGDVWARLGWWGRLDLRVSSCRNLVCLRRYVRRAH